MKAITLRNIPFEIAQELKKRAAQNNISINKAVLHVLSEALGLRQKPKKLHHDLDRFAGLWSKQEAKSMEEALASQRQIDPDLWK